MKAQNCLYALKIVFLILVLQFSFSQSAFCQYFDLGTSAHSIRWKQMQSNGNKYVFAEGNLNQATRYMNYIDTLRPYINYGFDHAPLNFPVLMQPQNFASNGLMMLAPKRMEINIAPNVDSFSEPWLKQLASHEYRHAVQFANLNQNFVKVLSYIIGQQGSLIGAALLPLWFLEGDAVNAETQFSSYGRGMQPSFSIEHRAKIDQINASKDRNLDKWFCGSYKDYVPNHYYIGYQIVSYANDHYQTNIWNKLADYSSKYPFLIFPSSIAIRKFYDTSVTQLTRATFKDLGDFWNSVGEQKNSAELVSEPVKSYTTHKSPMPLNDSLVLSLKSDLQRPNRIVQTNINSGEEKTLFYTGSISSNPTLDELGRIFWTEYRSSTLWDQKINTQLCYFDLNSGDRSPKIIRSERQALFAQGLPNGEVAFLKYHYDGHFSINILDADLKNSRILKQFPQTISLHGLTYDSETQKFYLIALDDMGMSIISVNDDAEIQTIKKPAYITLSDLRAQKGRLYFHSIASGLDEAHTLDLNSGKEYQLTLSHYGSFAPMPTKDNTKILTTQYSADGYLLAQQSIDTVLEVKPSILPINKINPPRSKWDVPNIDTIIVSTETDKEVKSYSKATHLFNIHSWAPFSYNPGGIIDEDKINIDLGATLISQNLLNSAVSYISYAWTDNGSTIRGGFEYLGLAPKFNIEAEYSQRGRPIYIWSQDATMPTDKSAGYFNMSATAYLPLTFSSGYFSSLLQPSVSLTFDNSLFQEITDADKYSMKSQKLVTALQFLRQSRQATRDLQPRWGYHLMLSSVFNPFTSNFGTIYSAYASAYLPGIAINHGIKLSASYQYQDAGIYNYIQKDLFPRGCDYSFSTSHYTSTSFDYTLPLFYPDGGINSILYFKRVSAKLGFDYAHYKKISKSADYSDIYSYGCEFLFDVNLFRTPSMATTQFGVWIFKPSTQKGVATGINISLPL